MSRNLWDTLPRGFLLTGAGAEECLAIDAQIFFPWQPWRTGVHPVDVVCTGGLKAGEDG
jgi:hypothetical protein